MLGTKTITPYARSPKPINPTPQILNQKPPTLKIYTHTDTPNAGRSSCAKETFGLPVSLLIAVPEHTPLFPGRDREGFSKGSHSIPTDGHQRRLMAEVSTKCIH